MNRWRKDNRRRRRPLAPPKPQPSRSEKNILLRPVASFVAALRFLTIIPLPGQFGTSEEELARATPFFPFVGLLIGCVAVPAAWGLHLLLPAHVAAVMVTLVLLSFSGGLHLDGLADTADGFFSARTREKMLEIMRDSSTGPMGAATLVLFLLLKVACLSTMSGNIFILAAFLMPIAGRTAILLLMALLPYVRFDGGLGSLFFSSFNNRNALLTALAGLIFFAGIAWAAAKVQGILAVFFVLLLTALFAVLCRRRIGGVTGDTLGAVCELAEAAVTLAFVLKM